MPQRIEFTVGDNIHTYRYPKDDCPYAIVICHGAGGWGGMYDDFCYPFQEATGADIWSFDCPGFGLSGRARGDFTIEEFEAALEVVLAEIRKHHNQPIFALGSSMGGMLASIGFYKEQVAGVCIQASPLAVTTAFHEGGKRLFSNPGVQALLDTPAGKNAWLDLSAMMDLVSNYGDPDYVAKVEAHPLHTSKILLKSWAAIFQYEAPYPLTENEKPFLYIHASRDPMLYEGAPEAMWEGIGGPKQRHVVESDKHQVMLFHTDEFVEVMSKWASQHT